MHDCAPWIVAQAGDKLIYEFQYYFTVLFFTVLFFLPLLIILSALACRTKYIMELTTSGWTASPRFFSLLFSGVEPQHWRSELSNCPLSHFTLFYFLSAVQQSVMHRPDSDPSVGSWLALSCQ